MKKYIYFIPIMLSSFIGIAESRPLLLSDLNPQQLYSETDIKQQIASYLQNKSRNNYQNNSQDLLSPLQQEYEVWQTISNIDSNQLSQKKAAYLAKFVDYQSKTYRKHPEGPLPIKIFDIASMAKHKLQQARISQLSNELKDAAKVSLATFFLSYSEIGEENQFKLARKVVQQLPIKTLTELGDVLNKKKDISVPEVTLLSELARVTQRKEDYEYALLNVSEGQIGHKLLADMVKNLSANSSSVILKSLISKKEILASHAMSQYAKLPEEFIDDQLIVNLLPDNKLGISAAQYVSSKKDNSLLLMMANIAQDPSAARTQVANALLALRLSESIYAKELITQLIKDEAINYADMSEEVARWVH